MLLTLLFRNNSASIRYWLWFAASLKFLLPFSLLAALGRMAFVHTGSGQLDGPFSQKYSPSPCPFPPPWPRRSRIISPG